MRLYLYGQRPRMDSYILIPIDDCLKSLLVRQTQALLLGYMALLYSRSSKRSSGLGSTLLGLSVRP